MTALDVPPRRRSLLPPLALGLAVALAACAGKDVREEPAESTADLMAAGAAAERRGDFDTALVEYVKALGDGPRNAEAHFRIGRVHRALGNAATARDAYARALQLQPEHVGGLEGMGLLLLEQGNHDGARELLHKAASKPGVGWGTFNGLGVLADLDGKHDLARSYFRHGLDLQPNHPQLLNNLGYSHYLAGEYDAARSLFNRALSVDAGNRNAWSNLALVHARRGEYDQAVQSMERIMDPASARYSVGYICMLDGKLAEAERLFSASIQRSSSYNPKAHAALDRVRAEQVRERARAAEPQM